MTTSCYHCQLPVPDQNHFHAEIDGVKQPMCCPGCKAVAEAISAGGLNSYYRHRTDSGLQADSISDRLKEELEIYNRVDIQKDFVQILNDDSCQASLLIEGITCAACVWLIEKHIGSLAGVERVTVNLSTHEAQITWNPEAAQLSTALLEIYRIGYKVYPWRSDRQEAMLKQENRQSIRRLAVAGIGAMQVMMYAVALYSGAISNDMADIYRDFIRYISAIVATPVVFYAAAPFFRAASRDIKVRHLGMDVPVSIAIGGAYIASLWATFNGNGEVYFDSVSMFTFFLLTGRYLELKARHTTARAARVLTNLLPPSSLKLIDGNFIRVPVADLQPGDHVRILPGDAIPADGTLIEGSSSLDESMLTGEYMPVGKQCGDTVLCGSLNMDNAIQIRIIHVGQETRMAGIVQLLKRAQQDKPAVAHLADRVAGWFVAAVLIVAVMVYWYWSRHSPEDAFWITLSVLVVTCPCALSLATPTALTAATGYLHKMGLLITRGHVLEGLEKINHVIFDKTGTLTKGALSLATVQPIPSSDTDSISDMNEHSLLAIASALESHSEHPIAKAFSAKPQAGQKLVASNVISHTGKGLEGTINNTQYRIGKPNFSCPLKTPDYPEQQGQWLLLCDEHKALCWFRITDSLRPEALETITSLKSRGLKVTLLSGDQSPVVESTAGALGIDHWKAEASPDDKLDFIRAAQKSGDKVLMVGDGINDVPVLAGADISLAMGNASDLARTSADAVLISANLNRLTDALNIAIRTRKIIRQNLTWSLGYNMTALPLAASAMIAPWMAAIGMALSSLIVVGNALRLSRSKNRVTSNTHRKPLTSSSSVKMA